MIKLENIVKTYHMGETDLTVLKGINVNVADGEMVGIMGPSGSGKTTLLNVIGCLDKASSGKYYFAEKDISGYNSGELAVLRGQKIGFIFQTFNLLSRLSALSNVELGMMYSIGVNREKAREALNMVGLSNRVKHRPIGMSGGEQQRVAIARALVKDPMVFLADEPTGQLDSKSGKEVMAILSSLQSQKKITVLIVTHDTRRSPVPEDNPRA